MHRYFIPNHHHGNVVFNFTARPIDDLTAFALGYRKSGRSLATNIAASHGYADYDGYPILFLYRHALELYLKAVVYRGARLIGLVSQKTIDTNRLFERHDLSRLLPAIRAIFSQMGWDFEGSGLDSFDDFSDLIQSIDSIDPDSSAFRYPVNRTGAASLPQHFVVNVVEFSFSMERLLNFLEGAAIGINENWQAEAEATYELQQLTAEWQDE
jgi:hypothetical protein